MARVLIIEDENAVARMYKRALEADGFEAEIAEDGAQGLAKVKEYNPDMILLDIMMPGMSGVEVLQKLESDPQTKNIPLALLTNLSGSHETDYKQKGADAFWLKTDIRTTELSQKITALLNEKKQQ